MLTLLSPSICKKHCMHVTRYSCNRQVRVGITSEMAIIAKYGNNSYIQLAILVEKYSKFAKEMTSKRKVLVTGFGPFGEHKVNASWVAVQRLAEFGVKDDVELVTREIPVDYDMVKEIICSLWEEEKPDLVVLVGVSGIAEVITIEQQAHNDGYCRKDVKGVCPLNQLCIDGAQQCLVSELDMCKVAEAINNSRDGIKAEVSMDPGRYLCDFSYYVQLSNDPTCSAFIHVPPLGAPYTADQLAQGLRIAIIEMLRQIQ